jgi:drug/metabolite transporter superfamily protein YnfA
MKGRPSASKPRVVPDFLVDRGDAMKLGLAIVPLLIFVAAALLEVGGDAVIRQGLRGQKWVLILGGCLILGVYGVVVNTVKWDFSRLLGVYVAVFALVSVLVGRFWFRETVPSSTWVGLAIIVLGGLVIQFGDR